ncbi:MAG: hypothetical protein AB1730_12955 [Myxococcota bacterium]
MGCGRLFAVVLAAVSGLLAFGGFYVCQRAGWHSDGPGLLCPMGVMVGGAFVAVIALWTAFVPRVGPPGT